MSTKSVFKAGAFGFLLVGALAFGLVMGIMNHEPTASAQENAPTTYVIQAGAGGPANMEILAFAPQSVQVHRGDVVAWANNGFHNIRFADGPTDLVIVEEVDGAPVPQINPLVAFPSGAASGSAFTGEAASGLPILPDADPVFSLVIDVEPGTYSYVCDVHPGMIGSITVVEDDVAVPGPSEVALMGAGEFGAAMGAGTAAVEELDALNAEQATTEIQVGSAGPGRVTINQFYPFTAIVNVGDTVNFTNPEGSNDPHTVSWPAIRGQDVAPIEREGGPPILALGPSTAPMTESGSEVGAGDAFSSGLFVPGQTFSLTFTEAGVYPYVCNIHPGMTGTIIVQ